VKCAASAFQFAVRFNLRNKSVRIHLASPKLDCSTKMQLVLSESAKFVNSGRPYFLCWYHTLSMVYSIL